MDTGGTRASRHLLSRHLFEGGELDKDLHLHVASFSETRRCRNECMDVNDDDEDVSLLLGQTTTTNPYDLLIAHLLLTFFERSVSQLVRFIFDGLSDDCVVVTVVVLQKKNGQHNTRSIRHYYSVQTTP